MTPAEAKDPLREKHLRMIQGIITRQARNSFTVRKWSVGIVTAVLAFSAEKSDWRFALLAAFPAAVFWYLDAFYLYQERRFRTLFDRIRQATVAELVAQPYFLNPDYNVGATAFPTSGSGPKRDSVFAAAFGDGLTQLHWVTVLSPVVAAYFLHP